MMDLSSNQKLALSSFLIRLFSVYSALIFARIARCITFSEPIALDEPTVQKRKDRTEYRPPRFPLRVRAQGHSSFLAPDSADLLAHRQEAGALDPRADDGGIFSGGYFQALRALPFDVVSFDLRHHASPSRAEQGAAASERRDMDHSRGSRARRLFSENHCRRLFCDGLGVRHCRGTGGQALRTAPLRPEKL